MEGHIERGDLIFKAKVLELLAHMALMANLYPYLAMVSSTSFNGVLITLRSSYSSLW